MHRIEQYSAYSFVYYLGISASHIEYNLILTVLLLSCSMYQKTYGIFYRHKLRNGVTRPQLTTLGFEARTNQNSNLSSTILRPKPPNCVCSVLGTKPAKYQDCIVRRDSPMSTCMKSLCPQSSGLPSAHDTLP